MVLILSEGETIVVMKMLKIIGSPIELKRGMVIKHIHLIDDKDDTIECKMGGAEIVLKQNS